MSRGRISSATILTGGAAFEDVCQKASLFNGCSFGVHLYLTDLHPSTDPRIFADHGLLSSSGAFNGSIRNAKATRHLKQAIYKEWCAQLDRARAAGLRISHVDSHHHVHTIPWMIGTLSRLARRYRIPAIRRSMDLYYWPEVSPPAALRMKKCMWNTALPILSGAKVTRHFTNFNWFFRLFGSLESGRKPRVRGPVELMCHPGNPGFAEETRLLDTDWRGHLGLPAELITYNDL